MKIVSYGEILWDVYDNNFCLGGAPLNFAAFSSAFGADSYLVSAVGSDELGQKALLEAKRLGINTEYISESYKKPTGKCIVSLNEKAVPTYEILDDVAYDYIEFPHFKEDIDVISFGTMALRKKNNTDILKKILRKYSFSEIFADLNIRAPFYSKESILFCLENATIVKISEEELPVVTKLLFNELYDFETAAKKISTKFSQIRTVIITRGENGSFCYDSSKNSFFYSDAVPTTVVSTVGAGDSFGAAFIYKYKETEDCLSALKYASQISSLVCAKKEAVPKDVIDIIKH